MCGFILLSTVDSGFLQIVCIPSGSLFISHKHTLRLALKCASPFKIERKDDDEDGEDEFY